MPRRLQAWYAHGDFKAAFTQQLDVTQLRKVIEAVTVESYPSVHDGLIGNLAYTAIHCQDADTRDLAEQTLAGYIAWKRASGATVFNRERLSVGIAALGVAVIGGVLVYRVRNSNDA